MKAIGPGIAIAATGVGAGDMVAAAVAGAKYGTAILWAAAAGAVMKYALNEGLARWQLATGTTLIEGWTSRLGLWVSVVFAIYLVLWSFIVAGALIAACGLAAHALVADLSVSTWGILHATAAFLFVFFGRYLLFEKMMKLFIGLMFVVLITCAFLLEPALWDTLRAVFVPTVPPGSGPFLLGVIGGVGGSVTLLNYGYWIREKGWRSQDNHHETKFDLGSAYTLTGIFGIAVMVIAAHVSPEQVTGNRMALEIARRLELTLGTAGKWIFLLGFWGAVASSMLGVWQGVPYIFADFLLCLKARNATAGIVEQVNTRSFAYRAYLAFLAFPPMILLYIDRPVMVIVVYAIAGALFMPFLAGTLLYLNNKQECMHGMKNGRLTNGLLLFALVVFGYLCWNSIAG